MRERQEEEEKAVVVVDEEEEEVEEVKEEQVVDKKGGGGHGGGGGEKGGTDFISLRSVSSCRDYVTNVSAKSKDKRGTMNSSSEGRQTFARDVCERITLCSS